MLIKQIILADIPHQFITLNPGAQLFVHHGGYGEWNIFCVTESWCVIYFKDCAFNLIRLHGRNNGLLGFKG
jgi:hypothetical protein